MQYKMVLAVLLEMISNNPKKMNDTIEPIIANVLYIGAYVLLCLS